MRHHRRILTAGILLTLAVQGAQANHRIALLDFSTDDNSVRSQSAGAQAAAAIQAQLGDIPDMSWVERAELAAIRQEIDLGQSALVAADAIRVGRMLKAEIILQGRFVTRNKARTLQLEAVDLFRAEVLATRSVPCPGSTLDPVTLTPEFIQNATQAARETITDATAALKQTSTRRTLGGLFIRNISANDRLDYLTTWVLGQLANSVNKTDDLHWLNFSRVADANAETQLALLGLTSPDPAAWRSPADLYLWGSVEEKADYSGPADQVPFTIVLTIWDGTGALQELRGAATPATCSDAIDKLCLEVQKLARAAQPQNLATTRANIAAEITRRSQELRATTGGPGRLISAAERARIRFGCELLDLALFLTPDNQRLRYEAISSRRYLTQNTLGHYASQLQIFRQYLDYIDQYKYQGPDGAGEFMLWSNLRNTFSSIFWLHENNIISISSGMPYDLTGVDKQKIEEDLIRSFQRATLLMMSQRERLQVQSNPALDFFDLSIIRSVLRSDASPPVKIDFVEALWPLAKPAYLKRADYQDRDVRDLRRYIRALYTDLGRPRRAEELLAVEYDLSAKVLTVNVPPEPKYPEGWPMSMRPGYMGRMAPLIPRNPDPADSQPDTGPAAQAPLRPAVFEEHLVFSVAMRPMYMQSMSPWSRQSMILRRAMPEPDAGSLNPTGFSNGTLWFRSLRNRFTSNQPFRYEPALMRIVPYMEKENSLLNVIGVASWRKFTLAASSTEGLVILDPVARTTRVMAGLQGLATTSLEAIAADGNTVVLAGSDNRNKSRIIRFDPVNERFEDLVAEVPSNQQLWLRNDNLIYCDASGYVWRNLKDGSHAQLSDILAAAGITLANAGDIKELRILGFNAQGLWIIVHEQLICVSPDRKKILTRLSLKNVKIATAILSEDGQYAFLIVNPWTIKEGLQDLSTQGCYMLAADLVQNQWVTQCRIPAVPESITSAAGRIWFSGQVSTPLLAINRAELGLRAGPPVDLPPNPTVDDQLATAVYNGSATALADLAHRQPGFENSFVTGVPYEKLFSIAPESTLREFLEQLDPARQDLPNSALFAAVRRNAISTVNLILQSKTRVNMTENSSGRTPLRVAALYGHEEIVESLLAAGASTDSTGTFGETPLTLAITHHRTGVIKLLLRAKVRTDAFQGGYTPLQLAVLIHDPEIVDLLLAAGADPNVFNRPAMSGNESPATALMLAARYTNPRIAEALLAKGADPNLANPQGENALSIAATYKNDSIIALLKKHGATLPDVLPTTQRTRISSAIRTRDIDELKRLLDGGADPNLPDSRGIMPLCEAANTGVREMIMELLRHGAKPDQLCTPESADGHAMITESTYQQIAIAQAKIAGVATTQFAVPAGTSPSPKMPLNLSDAIEAKNNQAVLRLLGIQNNLNTLNQSIRDQWPLLARAVAKNMTPSVQMMLQLGADPDIRGPENTTPLMVAAAEGNEVLVQLLINFGARPHLRNSAQLDAAQLALAHGHSRIATLIDPPTHRYVRAAMETIEARNAQLLKLILDDGLAPDSADPGGQSLLMSAIRSRSAETVTILLDRHAPVNQQDRQGRSALHWVLMTADNDKKMHLLEQLVKAGANPDLADRYNVTPRQIAARTFGNGNTLFRKAQ